MDQIRELQPLRGPGTAVGAFVLREAAMEDNTNQWLWFVGEELVRTAIAVEPENPELLRRAAAHPALAKAMRAKLRNKADEALAALAPALAEENPDALDLAGQIHFEAGRMVEAAEAFGRLSELRADQLAPVFNRGLCLARMRKWPAAADSLQKAVLLAPDRAEVWYSLGICLLNQRRGAEAKAAFAYSLKLRSDYAPAWLGQASALQLEQKHREALDIYERLLEAQPDREELLANALVAAVATRNSAKIHALASRLLSLRPANLPALLALASASAEEQNYEEARRWCMLLTEVEPTCYDHWYNLGLCRYRLGDTAGAEDAFAESLRLNSEGVEAWTCLARCATETGQPDLALEAWQAVTRLEPEHSSAWFQIGLLRYDSGNLAEALEAFERCANLQPESQIVWLNVGACRLEAGKLDEAEAAFQEALAQGNESGPAANALVSLAARRGDLEAAVRRREELNVTDPATLFDLAILCQSRNRLEEARDFYAQVVEAQPDFAQAAFNLGSVLFALGQTDEGAEHWKTALKIAPELARNLIAAWGTSGSPGKPQ